MIINKSEKIYLIGVLMKKGLTKKEAKKRIDNDNGYLKELTSKVRKKKNKEKKEKTKRFSEEFRKMKTKKFK